MTRTTEGWKKNRISKPRDEDNAEHPLLTSLSEFRRGAPTDSRKAVTLRKKIRQVRDSLEKTALRDAYSTLQAAHVSNANAESGTRGWSEISEFL